MTSEDSARVDEIKKALLDKKLQQRLARQARQNTIERVDRTDKMAIADQQRFLWFLHQMVGGAPVYNVPFAMRLRGKLDVDRLSGALHGIVARHESLRTSFGDEHGVPFQTIREDPGGWELPVEEGSEDHIQEWIDGQVRPELNLRESPYRFALLRLGDEDHVLSIVWHHIVIDGWSARQFAEELEVRYANPQTEFTELNLHPADYAAWQRVWLLSEEMQEQVEFWKERLDGVEPLALRGDRERPAAPTGAGRIYETELPSGLAAKLRQTAESMGVSLLALMMSGYQVVMSKYASQRDIALGTVLSGRTRSETEPMLGFFANTVPIRVDVTGDLSVRELVNTTHETILDAMAHQDVPFGRLVEAVSPERVPGRNPVVHHLFTMLPETMIAQWVLAGLEVEMLTPQPETTRFDITFQVNDLPGGGLGIWIEYSSELFDLDTIIGLIDHFAQIMGEATADLDCKVNELNMLTPQERQAVIEDWNPDGHQPPEGLLHELVSQAVGDAPGAIAMRFQDEDLTYQELGRRSDALAQTLKERGVSPNDTVAVLLDRGFDLPVSQLAVLKAGAAWLPIDPQYPEDRIAYQLDDSKARLVITTKELSAALPEGKEVCYPNETATSSDAEAFQTPQIDAEATAYVIYTSGSTGEPKGVMVPHRAIVNFCRTFQEMFSVSSADNILQFSNPAFDVSVSDVFATLSSGATIIGAPRDELLDPDRLQALMAKESVTIVDIPPAVLGTLDPSAIDTLRVCFIGMEPFGPDLVNRWSNSRCEFHNGYGPTEVTVTCVDYKCPDHIESAPPIGRAMENQRAYVLDTNLQPTPIGAPGELYMGGAGLATGYLGRPAQTAEKFLPDPFTSIPGARMYATGDLVRWNREGQLEFLGRIDRQVKLRGLRVELGEVENVIEGHPKVDECVVTVQDQGKPSAWLAAYVVGNVGSDELREYLTVHLPTHMIPAAFIALEAIPRTSSAKVDINQLPDAEVVGEDPGGREPSTKTEQQVAEIWQGLLGMDSGQIKTDDNFFLLGGNSLQVTQLVSRVREKFQVTLDPRKLFSYPLLALYAQQIEEAQRELLGEDEVAEIEAEVAEMTAEDAEQLLRRASE